MSEKVAIFDTTLRDGEQAAGTRLGRREKMLIARQLACLQVDVIEAGYPASSPEDFEAVQQIGREIHGPAICALSRAVPADIEAFARGAGRMLAATHPHRNRRLRYPHHGQVPRRTIRQGPRQQASHDSADGGGRGPAGQVQAAPDVEFYAEDLGRADRQYLLEMIAAVVDEQGRP